MPLNNQAELYPPWIAIKEKNIGAAKFPNKEKLSTQATVALSNSGLEDASIFATMKSTVTIPEKNPTRIIPIIAAPKLLMETSITPKAVESRATRTKYFGFFIPSYIRPKNRLVKIGNKLVVPAINPAMAGEAL